jgi:flagellar basal-body rod protein FlgF
METPSLIALSRQMTLRRQMDVLANNIANANTVAFRGQRMIFAEYLAQAGPSRISFVQDIATARNTASGGVTETGNPFDLTIRGEGYFTVRTPLGERYSRNGHFMLDAEGQLVTDQGFPLLSVDGQPLVFAPEDTNVKISRDGTVTVKRGNENTQATEVGQIRPVRFTDEQALRPISNSLFAADETPREATNSHIIQGSLEESNVKVVLELTHMIQVLRTHQGVRGMIEKEHERMLRAINKLADMTA